MSVDSIYPCTNQFLVGTTNMTGPIYQAHFVAGQPRESGTGRQRGEQDKTDLPHLPDGTRTFNAER